MWENVIAGILIAAAVLLMARMICRAATGKGGCSCTSCLTKDKCDKP